MTRASLNRTIAIATVVVAMSTFLLPLVQGYGTILYQVVVLGAWRLVAKASSGTFADQNHAIVWMLALPLNVLLFFVPSALIWVAGRRWNQPAKFALVVWAVFYLASLFLLFPATDGP